MTIQNYISQYTPEVREPLEQVERVIQAARPRLDGHDWLIFIEAASDRFNSLTTDWGQHDDEAFPAIPDPGNEDELFVELCPDCIARLEASTE